jgi:multiple RNA-binding domain-containing protein 1
MSRVIVKDLPKNLKAEQLKKHFAGVDTITESSLRFTESGVFRRFAFVGYKNQDSGAKAVEQLDSTYIGMSKIKVELAKNWQEIKSQSSTSKKKTFKGEKAKTTYKNNDAPSEDLILQTGRLFLRNLPYDCKAEDIEALFSNYGKNEVHLVINRVLKTSVGTCFVNFSTPEEARKAYKELDGIDFQGRLLHIMPAHPKQETPAEAAVWKKKKEETKKPKAHKWNTLFVSSNATADVIAERLKISKSDLLLKPGNSSVAARIAVGESQIVSEIKEFLLENGVALDSFGEADGPRSKTVILVKHLNAFTTADSLRTIFERYGTIVRLVLPPCGMSALIEFAEPSEAKFAFEKLDMTTVSQFFGVLCIYFSVFTVHKACFLSILESC